jgi:uncharacterized damage-inducible protein DinB
MTVEVTTVNVLTTGEFLQHWQGHRRLTRRTIEVFPEDKLFHFSLGGMRPFADMVFEFIGMAVPIVDGVSTGKWEKYAGEKPAGIATIQYAVDNEIHHRGQAYVYLRALGIEPPHFWERD